ncbi:putative LSM domain, eukaryotic/archaea-type, LSM domain superfamily protein [Dioscorea sansibarensis]
MCIGFDEYMNLVLEDAEELNIKKKTRKQLGKLVFNIFMSVNGQHISSCLSISTLCVVVYFGKTRYFLIFAV